MNRTMKALTLLLLALALSVEATAQDIEITRFELAPTSLLASTNPVTDNNGQACAVVRFFVRSMDFEIDGNLGVLKRDTLIGELRLWMPRGTKRITVRHIGMPPLNYRLKQALESKCTYEATIETTTATWQPSAPAVTSAEVKPATNEASPEKQQVASPFYIGAGFKVLPAIGMNVVLGLTLKQHNLEVGATYGKSTDEFYFYHHSEASNDFAEAYKYSPLQLQARYGYAIPLSRLFSVTPQAGISYTMFTGSGIDGVTNSGDLYKLAHGLSLLGAAKLSVGLGKHLQLHVTPEFHVVVKKDNTCKWVDDGDNAFKNWTQGFGLSAGITISF